MPFASASLLQLEELKELVAEFAGSEAGRARLAQSEPLADRAAVADQLHVTGEALAYYREAAAPQTAPPNAAIRLRFDQVRPLEPHLRALRVEGARLDGRQILDLFQTFELAGEFRSILVKVWERFPRLAGLGNRLSDLREITRQYGRAFLPDGSLADEASPALGRLRRDIQRQHKTIQQSLERFIRGHRDDGAVQEDFVTLRDDRYVVPIVSGRQGRVAGVIHGASSSGRSLYVEPLETIDLNNQLVRLRDEEQREVERILGEITRALAMHGPQIAITVDTLAELDFLFAKAAFGVAYEAVIPRLSKDGPARRLLLREARHPLLESVLRRRKRPIVPLSFELNEERRCLLISGPNTGGKTVTLKTAGLLALMALAGFPVPATEAEIPVFSDVLADVGDQQSIAESLSSFSAHLLHIKEMLSSALPEMLVLLDELGRATDPEEGGALGVAVLDAFRRTGLFCLASTHLLPLKLYGTQTPNVLNASMGFDEQTLQPTYALQLGLPGKSAGLDIASRLELPPDIIQHARAVLPRLQGDFQQLLARLHQQQAENEQRAGELAAGLREADERRALLERQSERQEEERRREWERRTEELVRALEHRSQTALERLSEVAQQRKAEEQAARLVAKTKREMREEAARMAAPRAEAGHAADWPAAPALTEGARVRLRDVSGPVVVRRFLSNGLIEVEAGFLKLQVAPDDVLEVVGPSGSQPTTLPGNVRLSVGPRWEHSYRELNVIGQRAEEALENVDKFLDSAALASVQRVRIVHGFGMGILKRAVTELLTRNPHVSRFYPADASEGGGGATIVDLRE